MPVTLQLPGGPFPAGMFEQADAETREQAPRYAIPPIVWMFVFLLAGWLILRMILED